ncbi:MAG: hypothetical protein WCQ00_02330 [bacterium]
MPNGIPNFDNRETFDPEMRHIAESIDPLIAAAPEEELSPNIYVTYPDGTHIFIPKKDLKGGVGEFYVEYNDIDGKTVREYVTEADGKFDILSHPEHHDHERHSHGYDPRQKELGL